MEYFEEIQDRVILIGVQANLGDDMEESLDELGELAATAGAYVAGRIIQNNAPGPPAEIAVATPTILPVPIVADNAVQRAPKLVTSPCPSSSFFTMNFNAFPRYLT